MPTGIDKPRGATTSETFWGKLRAEVFGLERAKLRWRELVE